MRGTRLLPPLSLGRRRACLIHGVVVFGLSLLGLVAVDALTATRALAQGTPAAFPAGSVALGVVGGVAEDVCPG